TEVNPLNEEFIRAYPFTVNLSDVGATDFVLNAQAEAWNTTTGATVGVTLKNPKPTVGGAYNAVFETGLGTTITVVVTVVDNILPVITADGQITYEKDSIKTEAAFFTDISATLSETGTITSDFSQAADLTTAGIYLVTLGATDTSGNIAAEKSVLVIITDGLNTEINSTNGEMIKAYPFTMQQSHATTANYVAKAQSQAWDLTTQTQVMVTLKGTQPTTPGTHTVIFTTLKGTEIAVEVIVVDNIPLELTANDQVEYVINTAKTELEFFQDVEVALSEVGTITSDFTSVADLATSGVYLIRLNSTDLAGNKSNEQKVVLKVTDGENTEINTSTDEFIKAYPFTMNLSELGTTNFIVQAKAKAWDTSLGTEVGVQLKSEIPQTSGIYPITFTTLAGTDITTEVTIIQDGLLLIVGSGEQQYLVNQIPTDQQLISDYKIQTGFEQTTMVSRIYDNTLEVNMLTIVIDRSKIDITKTGKYPITFILEDTLFNQTTSQTAVYTVYETPEILVATGQPAKVVAIGLFSIASGTTLLSFTGKKRRQAKKRK
ncbi:MAG: LapB repeat-containing protein, partial [Culicoidibacterales bacterium]